MRKPAAVAGFIILALVIQSGFEPETYCLAYHYSFHYIPHQAGFCGLDCLFTLCCKTARRRLAYSLCITLIA
jgi:hypothetical protein